MALGINSEKTIAWIGEFPLIHFFTTKKFGNVASRYGEVDLTRLEEQIQKLAGEKFSRIHLMPYGNEVLIEKNSKITFHYLQRYGQAIFVKQVPETVQVLTIYPADCYPLFFTTSDYSVLGLIHGSFQQLKSKVIERAMQVVPKRLRIEPATFVVGIGPGIKKCCYKVDLLEMILQQLERAGIKKIFIAGTCTSCTKLEGEEDYLFFSHRRSKKLKGRFAAVLTSKPVGSG